MFTMGSTSSTIKDNNFVYEDMNAHNDNKGWICPKCGKAVNPKYDVCPYCSTQNANERLSPGEEIICD